MPMDMLEHESVGAQSSIASRGTSTIITLGDDGTNEELTKSFLIKRMEIQFSALADFIIDDASGLATAVLYLVLNKTSVANAIDTVAEQLDARMEDRSAHQQIIWLRPFIVRTHLVDDADNVTFTGLDAVFSTSKSFSKGFRLDKDETYVWSIFNPGSGSSDNIAVIHLRCRYWGIHIE